MADVIISNDVLAELGENQVFTEEHAETNRQQLHNKEIRYPKRYNVKHLSSTGLKLIGHCCLVDVDKIKMTDIGDFSRNIVWAGGVNPKRNDIEKSLKEHDFQLTHTPIALYQNPGSDEYLIVDGATRFAYMAKIGQLNVIADVYGREKDADDKTVEKGLGLIQTQANLNREVAGKVTDRDIVINVHSYIKRGYIRCNNLNEPSLVEIINFVTEFYDGHLKSQKKIENLAKLASDTYAQNTQRLVWQDSKDVSAWLGVKTKSSKNISSYFDDHEDLAENFGTKQAIKGSRNKFVDIPPQYDNDGRVTEGIKYLTFDTSQVRRAISTVCRTWRENPDTEIRIILYVKQITDYENPVAQFNSEINGFTKDYNSQLSDIRGCLFNNQPVVGGAKFYGALPSLESAHNTAELIFRDQNTGQWFQKNPKTNNPNNISSFDLLNSINYDNVVTSTNEEEEVEE